MNLPERKRQPDEIDWFQGSWEGNQLISLQNSWRTPFAQKLEWLEEMQEVSKTLAPKRHTTLMSALKEWAE
jgi:hypothetical protein